MTAATKTKRTKIDTVRPPVEIRENTKARRAWLAEKLAFINSGLATTTGAKWEGKIVGNGSYQEISVYEITEVAGRLRHRGHCQFCGNAQVVDNGLLVLHGYLRPGLGYIYNECPGVRQQPLQTSQTITEACLIRAQKSSADVAVALDLAKIEASEALSARFGGDDVEPDAYRLQPRSPGRRATPEEIEAYKTATREWAVRFPITARYVKAKHAEAELSDAAWKAKQQVDHFNTLLGWKLLGTALIEEVVA